MNNPHLLVSVVINNYNYGRFLRDAIESALGQTHPYVEVIVVDDGSTDNSRQVIEHYRNRVVIVPKANGGQASALNEGFAASRGDIICFLDSDDLFFPSKVERVLAVLEQRGSRYCVLLYHLLRRMDRIGRPIGGTVPEHIRRWPPNFVEFSRRYGFLPYCASPTSGLAVSRGLAEKIFPIPNVRVSADDFVVRAAALMGEVYGIPEVLGAYREHGENNWFGSESRKSVEFIKILEDYLNSKLLESHLDPVLDFNTSVLALPYAARSFIGLTRLALRVLARRVDLRTARFFLKAESVALACLFRGQL